MQLRPEMIRDIITALAITALLYLWDRNVTKKYYKKKHDKHMFNEEKQFNEERIAKDTIKSSSRDP